MNLDSVERGRELYSLGRFREAIEHLQILLSQDVPPIQKAGYLVDQANCYSELRQFGDSLNCLAEAKKLASDDTLARAQIDFCTATVLLKDDMREQGLEALSRMLSEYADLFRDSTDARELYEQVQMQRGLSLMHLSKISDALPLLKEAVSFELDQESKSNVHCHLGRCYHELAFYDLAKEQFQLGQALGITEEWDATFHYYFGYTLYELGDFSRARRELILCLQSSSSGPPRSLIYKMLAVVSRKLGETEQGRLYENMTET
jgi:tetratricopeptide (TPR) repeat protein